MMSGSTAPRAAFLTGATGYLGAFLLDELLARTSGPVHCLVRAKDAAQGLERLLAAQKNYELAGGRQAGRIRPVLGDLAKPGLALDEASRAGIAAEADLFIHCAASTNFLFGAPFLRNCNLEGTQSLINLARESRGGRLHYVSSASIFLSGKYGGQTVLEDQAPAEGDLRDAWGYQITKWQGEQRVQLAAAEGLQTSVSRPWFMGPHSRSGVASDHDFMLRLMDGCLALGMAPDIDITVNIMPIDWVSRAVVELALSADGGTSYLGNPHVSRWSQVVEQLNRHRPVATVPYAEWRAALRRAQDNPAWIFLPLFPEQYDPADTVSFMRRMCCDLTPAVSAPRSAERLASVGSCPPFHGAVLEKYLERRLPTLFMS